MFESVERIALQVLPAYLAIGCLPMNYNYLPSELRLDFSVATLPSTAAEIRFYKKVYA